MMQCLRLGALILGFASVIGCGPSAPPPPPIVTDEERAEMSKQMEMSMEEGERMAREANK